MYIFVLAYTDVSTRPPNSAPTTQHVEASPPSPHENSQTESYQLIG